MQQIAPNSGTGILAFPVVARIRRLLLVVVATGFVYSSVLSASKAGCLGGASADGFVDSDGLATEAPPLCYQLTLSASPVVLLALAVIVFVALGRIFSTARDTDGALRILDRASLVAVALVVASIVISYVWFAMIPSESWHSSTGTSYIAPFPFGSVQLETYPMPAS